MQHHSQISNKTVADFFAGIGLVTLGLERAGWKTIFALDHDEIKKTSYNHHFKSDHYKSEDIAKVSGHDIPPTLLAHASFPCTDLSVAGTRGGIHEGESSAFWQFIRILKEMKHANEGYSPPFILLENVEGLLTSNRGKDLRAILSTLNDLNYRVDLLRIDAANFVPQSRVRLFMIGVQEEIVGDMITNELEQTHQLMNSSARPKKIIEYIGENTDLRWYFHSLPNLPERKIALEEILDTEAVWWDEKRTEYLFDQMHNRHRKLLERKKGEQKFSYFPSFRRMRVRDGKMRSTAELRTDGIAGCLRTPKGGSARQIIVRAGRGRMDARLFNAKEAALLMGADEFRIDTSLSLNKALFGFGDAVCVPVIEWIGTHYFNTLISLPKFRKIT